MTYFFKKEKVRQLSGHMDSFCLSTYHAILFLKKIRKTKISNVRINMIAEKLMKKMKYK